MTTDALTSRSFLSHFFREIWLAVGGFALLYLGEGIAEARLPAAHVFDLTPRSEGFHWEVITDIVYGAGFTALYTLLGLSVRRSIARVLRVLMFSFFVLLFIPMRFEKTIAVVQKDSSFVLVRRWPLSPVEIPTRQLKGFFLRENDSFRSIELEQVNSGPVDRIEFESVRKDDPKTIDVLDNLASALEQAGLRRFDR